MEGEKRSGPTTSLMGNDGKITDPRNDENKNFCPGGEE
jgi:hypothetical protein